MSRTSDDYTSCLVLRPNGASQKGSIYRQHLMTVEQAIRFLGNGQTAYVLPEDREEIENFFAKKGKSDESTESNKPALGLAGGSTSSGNSHHAAISA